MQNCNSKFKITFFGGSSYVIPIIDAIKQDLSLIVTTEKAPNEPVISFCKTNKLPYLSISSFEDNHKSLILNLKSPLAVVADFGLMIPKNLLDHFEHGVLNIHPSLLPKYRGPTPVQTTILNGDKITGVSIIKLDNKIDHGPILNQEKEEIQNDDTSESLYLKLFKIGANLLPKTISDYLDEKIELVEQDDSKATYTKALKREDGYINLSSLGIRNLKLEIARKIRAYYPWPGAWTKWQIANGKWQIVKFLPEQKIQVEGKKPVSYKDFINGYPKIGKEILNKLILV